MAIPEIRVPYRVNYNFGVGVDLASASPMGSVVKGDVADISSVVGASGATTKFSISRIDSTSVLESTLGIDASASYGSGAFSGVSARLDFAKSSKIQTNSLFMAITAFVALQVLSIKNPTLTPEALALTAQPDRFAEHYGNMFVRSIERGGMFVAVMQIDTSSSDEAQTVSSKLEGAYGLFSAEAEMNLKEVQSKYQSKVQITVYHEGGPIDLTMNRLTDANEMYGLLQRWLKSFQDEPEKNACPYYATLASIGIANGAPAAPNWAQIQHAQDVLMLCAKERSTIIDRMNLMEFISQNPSRYDFVAPVTVEDVVTAFDGYQMDLQLVADAAAVAVNDATKAVTPAVYAKATGKVYPRGVPPIPMPTPEKGLLDVLAAKGQSIADRDPLVKALREQQPVGPARRGFDIGLGQVDGDTLAGPGKTSFGESLTAAEQEGYDVAVAFGVDRNRNRDYATRGAAIAARDPEVAAKRTTDPSVFFWLGFDVATGLFGDPAFGGQGDTAWGPGKQKIRDAFGNELERSGFDASMKLHLGPPARKRAGA